jgi:hypothetical protein
MESHRTIFWQNIIEYHGNIFFPWNTIERCGQCPVAYQSGAPYTPHYGQTSSACIIKHFTDVINSEVFSKLVYLYKPVKCDLTIQRQ